MASDHQLQRGGSTRFDEARLVDRVRERDLAAFEHIYRLHHPGLSRFVLSLVRRPPIAEEVVNDALMVLWDKPQSFKGESKLSTWLFAIAYRMAIKAHLRQDEPVDDSALAEVADEGPLPDRELSRARAAALLQDAIAQLSPDHRAVVHLTYFQEMGYREISGIVGCPVDTVKTRMFHARQHLKRKLAGELADWL